MRTVKILWLDHAVWFPPDIQMEGVKVKIVSKGAWGRTICRAKEGVIEPVKKVTLDEHVKKITRNKEVDLVVVGNNLGVGITMAKAIDKAMVDMTLVVWNSYIPGMGGERFYKEMGLKHFCSRSDLKKIIPDLLNLKN